MRINDRRRFAKNQAWVEWLSDETPSNSVLSRSQSKPRHTANPSFKGLGLATGMFVNAVEKESSKARDNRRANSRQTPSLDNDGDISINIHLPSFKLPKLHFNWRKNFLWGVSGALLISVVFGTPKILDYVSSRSKNLTNESASANEIPVYAPLVPESVPDGRVSGAQYDGKKQLYKYDDVYKEVSITVSQQPFPDQLRNNPAKIADIARSSIGATEKFRSTNGDVFIVTDEKTNTQRLVLIHRQLLVFIQSYDRLENDDWLVYLQSLR